jgi:hypothetical protein
MLPCCKNKIITYSKNIYSNHLQKALDIQTMTEVDLKSEQFWKTICKQMEMRQSL